MVEPRRFPSLSSIRAFECAARHSSFSGAARELETSAASVSYHVRQLEKEIGVPLFHRYPHKVALTPAGSSVADEAINAFAALRASFSRAVDIDEARLCVTTLPTIGTSWLTPKLGHFRNRHPEVTVELDLSVTAQDLVAGSFDVAVRNGHGKWPGLKAVMLFPSIFTPLCAPSVRQRVEIFDPSRTGDVPLLGRPDWWTIWYEGVGFHRGPGSDQFGTNLSAEHLDVAAAIAGHGIAIGSPILFADEIAAGRLVRLHDFAARDGRAFWLTYPINRHASGKISKFRDWLLSVIKDEGVSEC